MLELEYHITLFLRSGPWESVYVKLPGSLHHTQIRNKFVVVNRKLSHRAFQDDPYSKNSEVMCCDIQLKHLICSV